MRLSLLASSAIFLAACSGNDTQPAHGADGGFDAGADVVPQRDAGADVVPQPDAGADVESPPDAGGACRTAPPTLHRPTASACPSHETDAGVDSGLPRCGSPHDFCLVDSDCGSTGVCECLTPACTAPINTRGNVCVTPSDCHVDSDCACGFCAADTGCYGIDAYHCTTPYDECSTAADCPEGGTLTQCRWSIDHWACIARMACPG